MLPLRVRRCEAKDEETDRNPGLPRRCSPGSSSAERLAQAAGRRTSSGRVAKSRFRFQCRPRRRSPPPRRLNLFAVSCRSRRAISAARTSSVSARAGSVFPAVFWRIACRHRRRRRSTPGGGCFGDNKPLRGAAKKPGRNDKALWQQEFVDHKGERPRVEVTVG